MTLQQVAISSLLVGSEYFFSDYLQQKMDESPLPVALGNLAASIGTIAGTAWTRTIRGRRGGGSPGANSPFSAIPKTNAAAPPRPAC